MELLFENRGEHDCLRDFGLGKTHTGFYGQGGRFQVWFSASGKRRAYASFHIMKYGCLSSMRFSRSCYTPLCSHMKKSCLTMIYYDVCYDVMITIPSVELDIYWPVMVTVPSMELDIYWQEMATVPSMELDIYWPVMVTVPSMELDIFWPVRVTVPSVELDIYWPAKITISQRGARYIPDNNGQCFKRGARYILASKDHYLPVWR